VPAIASKLSPRSEDFKVNAAAMRALVDDLNAQLAKMALGGGDGYPPGSLGQG
jgi:3-methylcrotonyl-CoA carboxylase beta subunit